MVIEVVPQMNLRRTMTVYGCWLSALNELGRTMTVYECWLSESPTMLDTRTLLGHYRNANLMVIPLI